MSVQSYRARLEPAVCEMGVPGFEPHPLLKGAHVQTVVGRYIGGEQLKLAAAPHQVALPDGDRLLVLESVPEGWEPRMPAAVLVHGLAGCADANYMGRLSQRLIALGIRVVRMNLRGSGDGFGLARQIYHAGRSDDLRSGRPLAARTDRRLSDRTGRVFPGSESRAQGRHRSGRAPAGRLRLPAGGQCPHRSGPLRTQMRRPENRVYNWNFVRWLRAMVDRLHRHFPDLGPPGSRE